MLHLVRFSILCGALALGVVGCSSGGDDEGGGGDADLRNNACSTLSLNTKAGDLTEKIIDGTECDGEGSSAIVRIVFFENGQPASLCTGTMLTPQHVLTAAHCFDDTSRSVGLVINGTFFPARKVTVNPNFRRNGQSFGQPADFNDVAIIELSRGVNLPTLPILTSRRSQTGDVFAIFGYGTDENGELGVLKSGEMQADGVSGDHILSTFDGDGSNTCTGDSGGPAIFTFNGRPTLIGVTSSGTVEGCLEGDNSLFINIQTQSILDFIIEAAPGTQTL